MLSSRRKKGRAGVPLARIALMRSLSSFAVTTIYCTVFSTISTYGAGLGSYRSFVEFVIPTAQGKKLRIMHR